jgi:hypothetical protein
LCVRCVNFATICFLQFGVAKATPSTWITMLHGSRTVYRRRVSFLCV